MITGTPPSQGRTSRLILLAILALHVGILWAVFVPAPHSGGDNAAYLSLARDLATGQGYIESWEPERPPHTKYPPLYPALLALWMALGATTWTAFKVLSAALMLGSGALVFLWARGRGGLGLAAAVALLSVVSAGWVEASRWILSEPLFLVTVFFALWAGDRWRGGARFWLLMAVAGALAAFLTRTAGLPLLLALLALLALRRAWKPLAVAAVATSLPVVVWMLRGRQGGEGAYQSEFWMANPYDPALGTVGLWGIALRVIANLRIYVGKVLGMEWWSGIPVPPGALAALGIALTAGALVGWGLRFYRGSYGLAELFFPLYAGLILIWPEVWSGDRFVLPLYPLLLFWAGEGIRAGVDRWVRSEALRPSVHLGIGLVAVLALALPSVPAVQLRAEGAAVCRQIGATDPFACHGGAFQGFRDAAAWSGANLPEGAVVLNRKPRIFHVLGGTPGRVFPFSTDPAVLLEAADALGARYLLVDQIDGVSMAYLPGIVSGAPGAFCWVEQFGRETVLLGILPPWARSLTREDAGEIAPCPSEYMRSGRDPEPPPPSRPQPSRLQVPILGG